MTSMPRHALQPEYGAEVLSIEEVMEQANAVLDITASPEFNAGDVDTVVRTVMDEEVQAARAQITQLDREQGGGFINTATGQRLDYNSTMRFWKRTDPAYWHMPEAEAYEADLVRQTDFMAGPVRDNSPKIKMQREVEFWRGQMEFSGDESLKALGMTPEAIVRNRTEALVDLSDQLVDLNEQLFSEDTPLAENEMAAIRERVDAENADLNETYAKGPKNLGPLFEASRRVRQYGEYGSYEDAFPAADGSRGYNGAAQGEDTQPLKSNDDTAEVAVAAEVTEAAADETAEAMDGNDNNDNHEIAEDNVVALPEAKRSLKDRTVRRLGELAASATGRVLERMRSPEQSRRNKRAAAVGAAALALVSVVGVKAISHGAADPGEHGGQNGQKPAATAEGFAPGNANMTLNSSSAENATVTVPAAATTHEVTMLPPQNGQSDSVWKSIEREFHTQNDGETLAVLKMVQPLNPGVNLRNVLVGQHIVMPNQDVVQQQLEDLHKATNR